MIRTIIYLVTGIQIYVQEPVEEVRKMLQYSADGCFIALTLENGEPTYIARDHVISFKEF